MLFITALETVIVQFALIVDRRARANVDGDGPDPSRATARRRIFFHHRRRLHGGASTAAPKRARFSRRCVPPASMRRRVGGLQTFAPAAAHPQRNTWRAKPPEIHVGYRFGLRTTIDSRADTLKSRFRRQRFADDNVIVRRNCFGPIFEKPQLRKN